MFEDQKVTKILIDDLVFKVARREVSPPEAMTVQCMAAWINGYSQCQNDLWDIIKEMRGETDC